MNTLKLSMLTVMSCIVLNNQAQDKINSTVAATNIKSVTVFLSGAEVNCTSKVTLMPGSNEIVFENSSPFLNPNSVQIKALNNDVTIVSVATATNYLRDEVATGKLKVISDSLDDINLMVAIRQSHIKVYNDERDMVLSNKKIGGTQTLVTDDIAEMAEFFRKHLLDIEMKLIDANKQLLEYQKIQSRLLQQQRTLTTGSVKNTTEIILNASSKNKAAVDFEISYVVTNAGWVPKYDVRANDLEKPVELNFKADVYNATGFDWKNVAITLSTGNPSIDNTQPNMSPWYLEYYNAYNNRAKTNAYYKSDNAAAPAAYDAYGASVEEQVIESKKVSEKSQTTAAFTNRVESTVTNHFVISIPYTIKSDSKPYVVDIQKYDLPVMFNYLSIPKLDTDAFLLARISGWENLNLLPGTANIYFEGSFVGNSFLETNSTNDTLDLSMGRDKSIIIQREKNDEFCKNTVVGGNKKSMRGYEIKIKNTKSKEIVLEIKDQIPLSSYKEVIVEAVELGGATYDIKTGELIWKITLKPGESKTLNFKYEVKYPKNMTLTNF
jgi:uncharacterized protein (TIGR02231 family)